MGKNTRLELRNCGKCYSLNMRGPARLLNVLGISAGDKNDDVFWALRGVNLSVRAGEIVGVLGRNGSGKSTLLQLAAGVLWPNEGEVQTEGRVAAILELGAGFHPEFTGRENALTGAALLGLSQQDALAKINEIAAFADIGPFFDQPVKKYSSGMAVRLAFSVAAFSDPDLLILDEALAVGDALFQARCYEHIRKMRDAGVAVLFVTHDLEAAKRMCSRAMLLEHGRVVTEGDPGSVAGEYLRLLAGDKASPSEHQKDANGFRQMRHGDGVGSIDSCEILDTGGNPVRVIAVDAVCRLRFGIGFNKDVDAPILGFFIQDRLGTELIGSNTHQEKMPLGRVQNGTRMQVEFQLPINLKPGWYSVSPGLAYNQTEMRYMDYIHHALTFQVVDTVDGRHIFGLFHAQMTVTLSTVQ